MEGRAKPGYDGVVKPGEKINTTTSAEGGDLSQEKARVGRDMKGKDKSSRSRGRTLHSRQRKVFGG